LLKTYFADFHIHIGRSQGKPVKMAAAPSLTLPNLLDHAKNLKGLDVVTVIDGVCTGVQKDIRQMIDEGKMVLQPGGGYLYENGLLVLLGSEIEIAGPFGGAAHFGCWMPTLEAAHDFSVWLSTVQKNVSLSSQMARTDVFTLQKQVKDRNGIFIIHHAFTPHKGIYGNCVSKLGDMLDMTMVDALELGLSADTDMADCISEIHDLTFISDSDAHSLPKIAREYNKVELSDMTFRGIQDCLNQRNDAHIVANYGLLPTLGKYHRSFCLNCEQTWSIGASACPTCGSTKRVKGVYDRLLEVRDREETAHPEHRPPYVYQVPLEFIPGIGKKTLAKLLDAFGTEMAVLHRVKVSELAEVVGDILATRIDEARTGRIHVIDGGGGIYGKIAPGV
jgi:uncharacterized protein (TIGR00375 family)